MVAQIQSWANSENSSQQSLSLQSIWPIDSKVDNDGRATAAQNKKTKTEWERLQTAIDI